MGKRGEELQEMRKTARQAERRLDQVWREQRDPEAVRKASEESRDAWKEYNKKRHTIMMQIQDARAEYQGN